MWGGCQGETPVKAMTQLKTALTALALGLALLPAAHAQQRAAVKLPAGLKWETMRLATFDAYPGYYAETVSPEEKQLVAKIWEKEIAANTATTVTGKKMMSTVLMHAFEDSNFRYTFTSLNIPFQNGCEPPANGYDVVDMYSTCPMRFIAQHKGTGRIAQKDLPSYCFLHIDEKETPVAQNHTEIAMDSNGETVYFRIIQHGKPVPACNRAIRLK